MKKDAVEKRFRAVLDENGWCRAGRVLLGVSGGGDSMALLLLFADALGPERLVAAHLNHGVRETAPRDLEFTRRACARLGVEFVSASRSVPDLALKGESLEAAARRVRYAFYEETRARLACDWVALGHTRADLAESVLMNMARGCGLRGLAGIPPRRGAYVRPLLGFSRDELRAYLARKNATWVEDETNGQNFCLRNRVRNEVMPFLRAALNPALERHLASLAEDALEWRAERERRCAGLLAETRAPGPGWPALDIRRLRRMDAPDRVELLRFVGRRLGLRSLPRDGTARLDRLIVSSGRWVFQWGSEVDITACGGLARIHPASEKRSSRLGLRFGESARWGGFAVSAGESAPEGALAAGVPMDRSRPLEMFQSADGDAAFNDCLPEISQPGTFTAKRSGTAWEIRAERVQDYGVTQIVFTPLRGNWRSREWN